MEDKLVTLAIHTFEKAQILKTMLETEGIEVYIHNVNQIQPVSSVWRKRIGCPCWKSRIRSKPLKCRLRMTTA